MTEKIENGISFEQFEETLKLGNEVGELSRKILLQFSNGGIERNKILDIIIFNTKIAINKLIGDDENGDLSFNKIENISNNTGENIWEKALEFGNLIGTNLRKGLIKILKGETNEDILIKEIKQTTNHAINNILHNMGNNPNQEIINKINDNYSKRKITIKPQKKATTWFDPKNLGKEPILPGDPRYPKK